MTDDYWRTHVQLDVVVFDVNDTLLDLTALDPLFERDLGSAMLRKMWFGEMLVTAMTLNHIGRYESFSDIGRACLATTAARAGVRLPSSATEEILQGMRTLPPHPDVVPALKKLVAGGVTLATLTNSPPETAEAQLEHAGLTAYFGECITVADAGFLKPTYEVYAAAERRLTMPASALTLVAAHTWDLAAAAHAGWQTAFVNRGNQVPHPLFPSPDIVDHDLAAIAERITTQT